MGMLDRFADIIKANINDLLDKCEDPAKMIDQYLRDLTEDLAEVKQETAGVMAEETRTKRLVDENAAEVAKYDDLARKALAAGNEDDARTFLAKKQQLDARSASLRESYEAACANAAKMRQMHDKLVSWRPGTGFFAPYTVSPRMGWPMCAMWTRIWWVRPVSSRHST